MNKGQILDGHRVANVIEGLPVSYERRRYGRAAFFCWVQVYHQGAWVSLGDPWPKVTPSRLELAQAIKVQILKTATA